MPNVRRLRISNPHKSRRRSRRTKNPGVLYLMANPKKHRSRRRARRSSARRSRRHNPFFSKRAGRRRSMRRGHRRNPNIGGFGANELIKLALGGAAGTLATKYATQAILGDKNNGMTGYAVMAGVSVALGWASAKFLGRDVATGVVVGGLSAVTLRIFQEQVSGSSPASMSGYLGDPDFAGSLGEYAAGTYPVPGWSYGAPALAAAPAGAGAGAPAVGRSPRSMPRA